MVNCPLTNFYALLSIPQDATPSQVKSAYHRVLLQSHPDKHILNRSSLDSSRRQNEEDTPSSIDIAHIKEAYTTLSDSNRRAAYDAVLMRLVSSHDAGPRPAQVVSLEDFELPNNKQYGEEGEGEEGPWRYPCRCGGWYRISMALMEEGKHLVSCTSCSEVIWVGYEVVDD